MLDSLRIYPRLLGIAFRSKMQYRSDFFVGIFGVVLNNFVNLALISVLIARFQALAGWTFWEIVMLYAMWLLGHSFYAVFFWHISQLEDDILHGRFDQFLIRPVSPLVQFFGREINYMGFADVFFAVAAFALAYANLGLAWEAWKWPFLLLALAAGLTIETCIALIFGAIAFWTGRSRTVFSLSIQLSTLSQNYPLDIFGYWYRVFVTGFLPVAFINYYPLALLLDKPNALGIPALGLVSPVVAVLLVLLAAFIWKRGLAGYTSSGN